MKFDEIPTEGKREWIGSGGRGGGDSPFFASHPSQKINPESSSTWGARHRAEKWSMTAEEEEEEHAKKGEKSGIRR